jgi:hypothetical protein
LKKRDKKKESFGWDMFNSDSMYKAYERRISKLPEMDNNISREDYMASEVEM